MAAQPTVTVVSHPRRSTTGPVAVLDTPAALAALRDEWESLLDESGARSIFLTPTWILTWWDVFGADRALRVVTVRDDDGCLIGLAPFQIATGVEGLAANLRVLLFLGQEGDTLAEELDVIARIGAEDTVAQAVDGHVTSELAEAFDALRFERIRADSPVLPKLESALAAHGFAPLRENVQPSPVLTLPSDPDALRRGLSKNLRGQLRNARNRLAREGEVTQVRAGAALPVADAMDALIELHRKRWGPDDGSFETPAYIAFHRALSAALQDEGRLLLVVLALDGRPVAARYDFLYANRIWCFQGGWDPDLEKMRVGSLLTEDVLVWGIEAGYAEYAFLSGDDAYKRRWADHERTLTDLFAWGTGPRARRARRRQRIRQALKRFPPARWLVRLVRGGGR